MVMPLGCSDRCTCHGTDERVSYQSARACSDDNSDACAFFCDGARVRRTTADKNESTKCETAVSGFDSHFRNRMNEKQREINHLLVAGGWLLMVFFCSRPLSDGHLRQSSRSLPG